MVDVFPEVLLQPLGIYVIALGAGFLIPLFDRAHRGSAILVFLAALACMKPPALHRRFPSTCALACSRVAWYSRSTASHCWRPGISCRH